MKPALRVLVGSFGLCCLLVVFVLPDVGSRLDRSVGAQVLTAVFGILMIGASLLGVAPKDPGVAAKRDSTRRHRGRRP